MTRDPVLDKREMYRLLGAGRPETLCWKNATLLSVPDGLYVCHKCDVPHCVNPSHLFLGTPKDNTRDMFKKGRAFRLRGSETSWAKLTEEGVAWARKMYSAGRFTTTGLAELLGVTKNVMYQAIKGITWKHVPV